MGVEVRVQPRHLDQAKVWQDCFGFPWELVVSKAEMVLMKNCLRLKILLLKRMEMNQVGKVGYQILQAPRIGVSIRLVVLSPKGFWSRPVP
jgi:hypothetical protein